MLYPLKFSKHLVPKVWGGRNFEKILKIDTPDNKIMYGESWEISSHPNGMSYVVNGSLKGKSLEQIFLEYKKELVGDNNFDRFPLLIKYLDVNDRLSIQVHPNNEVALKRHNEFGKSECWYIIYASDDAKLVLGMKKGINKEKFVELANKNEFSEMFGEYSVKTGDFVNVPPGLVHASIEGEIVLAEIQQNSDITYRIYDFDRLDGGKLRPLHIKEAAESIDFELTPEIIDTNKINGRIIKTDYYTIDKLNINKEIEDISTKSFIIYSVLYGSGFVGDEEIKMGETILVPINYKVSLSGDMVLLRTSLE